MWHKIWQGCANCFEESYEKFGAVVVSIEESKYFSIYSVNEITWSVLYYESIINMEEESLQHAFNTQAYVSGGWGRTRKRSGRYNNYNS